MKKTLMVLLVMVVLGGISTLPQEGSARCVCRCVNGEVVPICDNPLDIPPICPPAICPPPPPSIRPIEPPTIPPIGTSNCRHEQVLNPHTGRYEWKLICY